LIEHCRDHRARRAALGLLWVEAGDIGTLNDGQRAARGGA
jgi:hypothetical protein